MSFKLYIRAVLELGDLITFNTKVTPVKYCLFFQVDFANKYIGGGELSRGRTQVNFIKCLIHVYI